MDTDVIVGIGGLALIALSIAVLYGMVFGFSWLITFLMEFHDGRRAAEQYREDVAAAEAEAQAWRTRQAWLDMAVETLYFVAEVTWQATECEESEEIDE